MNRCCNKELSIQINPHLFPSTSIKKQDGSWCFLCGLSRANANTIKDKFPIPAVDELFDELHGAQYFTKLDLRAGFHQIRMAPSDTEKTAFRTHHGHSEFLVMPFCVTNSPSTFHSLMNEVFRPHLCKFVLVFFDDILIYNKTRVQHMQHVKIVFEPLRSNVLFLKRSKCSFGESHVNYLGHVIHGEGVEVDTTKFKAITDWPTPQLTKALRSFLGMFRTSLAENLSI